MDIDRKIQIAKELIEQREAIDAQLIVLFGGVAPSLLRVVSEMKGRALTCKNCGGSGHSSSQCTEPSRSERRVDQAKDAIPFAL